MSLNNNQKTIIALGILVVIALLLSVFTMGYILNDDDSNKGYKNTQTTIISSGSMKGTSGYSNSETSKKTSKEDLPVLGQTLKEQNYLKSPATTTNNIEINIHNSGYYGYGSYTNKYYYHPYNKYNYYPHKTNYYKPSNNYYSGNKYYNSYYPYNQHGFVYTNSYGTTHKYYSW